MWGVCLRGSASRGVCPTPPGLTTGGLHQGVCIWGVCIQRALHPGEFTKLGLHPGRSASKGVCPPPGLLTMGSAYRGESRKLHLPCEQNDTQL